MNERTTLEAVGGVAVWNARHQTPAGLREKPKVGIWHLWLPMPEVEEASHSTHELPAPSGSMHQVNGHGLGAAAGFQRALAVASVTLSVCFT